MRPLGDLTINHDMKRRPVKESDRRRGPYPYYGASGVVDFVDGYLFDGLHLLVGEDGENLRTRQTPIAFLADGRFWVNNHAHIVTGNDSADTKYLLYALLAADISAYLTGAVMPKLTQGNLNRILLPCPPMPVQAAIVAVLGALDDRIALLRETNATLEAIARALFKSWFVDFDPVRAKQQGIAPPGMDDATAALFPDCFGESTLGPLPTDWTWGHLCSLAEVIMGLSPAGDSYNSEGTGVPLINGPVEFGDYFPVQSKWTTSVTRLAAANDLILCVRGSTTGRRIVSDGEYCIGRGVCAVRAKDDLAAFVHQTIDFGLPRLLTKTTGSVFPSLSAPDIKQFEVLVPPIQVRRAFEAAVKPLVARVQANHRQGQTLATLRDTLLPRLISGQLRLPEAEAALAAT